MYISGHGLNFNLMHFFLKLKSCNKWRLTRLSLKKAVGTLIDLDAPLSTSAAHPTCNKKAKVVVAHAASSKQAQSAIEKWKMVITGCQPCELKKP
jgi:hypothetical protein